jgi:AcrR family transcriptional regulator
MPKTKSLATLQALSPRKTPLQSRSTATRDAILQAAVLILTREGVGAFNTNRVAEVAGISVGSLYQYYPNKAALFTALSIEQHAQLLKKIEKIVGQVEKLTLDKAVEKLLVIVLNHQFENPELARTLDYAERELAVTDEVLVQKSLFVAYITEMLIRYRAQIKGDLRTAALDVLTITKALIDDAESRGETNSVALRNRVKRGVLGYLRG